VHETGLKKIFRLVGPFWKASTIPGWKRPNLLFILSILPILFEQFAGAVRIKNHAPGFALRRPQQPG